MTCNQRGKLVTCKDDTETSTISTTDGWFSYTVSYITWFPLVPNRMGWMQFKCSFFDKLSCNIHPLELSRMHDALSYLSR